MRGHEGLAGADVAKKHAVHRSWRRHVREHLCDRDALVLGGYERHRRSQACERGTLIGVRDPGVLARRGVLALGEPDLQHEQLVEDEPLPSCSQAHSVVGEVDLVQRGTVGDERVFEPHPDRQVIGHVGVVLDGVGDEPAEPVHRQSLGGAVHRQDTGEVLGVLFGGKSLDVGRLDLLDPLEAHRDPSREGDAVAGGELLRAVGLVEPHADENARTVHYRDLDDREARLGLLDADLVDAPDDSHVGPDLRRGQRRDVREVQVPERVVANEVADRRDVELGQQLGTCVIDKPDLADRSVPGRECSRPVSDGCGAFHRRA